MLALTELRDASMLEDEKDRFRELVFIALRALSRLLDEEERLRDEVWLVEMLAFATERAASTL